MLSFVNAGSVTDRVYRPSHTSDDPWIALGKELSQPYKISDRTIELRLHNHRIAAQSHVVTQLVTQSNSRSSLLDCGQRLSWSG